MRVILIIIIAILLVGCTPTISADTSVSTTAETNIITKTSIKYTEDTAKIDKLETENRQYKDLINNLNKLLSNVYYVYQKKYDGSSVEGTGFSIKYNSKYYLITAGHAVDNQYGIFKNLGFKANFSNEWVYPKLLTYEIRNNLVPDYAIFYSDKVEDGLIPDTDKDLYEYALGSLDVGINTIRNYKEDGKPGESGSPIIDYEGQVVGVVDRQNVYQTSIRYVLEVIDNL